MTETGGRNAASSLRKALRILDFVCEQPAGTTGVSLTNVSAHLGVNKSTAIRLIVPLLDHHLLERDSVSGLYRLGDGSLRLGQNYLANIDLRAVALPHISALSAAVHCTVHLVLSVGVEVVYIDKREDEATVRMASRIGARMPAYCTAVGKAMLAFGSHSDVGDVIDAGLTRVTDRTLTDPAAFRADLAIIRTRGYAIDDRENEPDVRCVAAPIFDHSDNPYAAMSISSLVSRMPVPMVRQFGMAVRQTALQVSAAIGSPYAARSLRVAPAGL